MSNNLIICEGLQLELKTQLLNQTNSECEINFYLQPIFINQFESLNKPDFNLGDRWLNQLYCHLFFESNYCFRLDFCTYYQHHQRQQAIISSTVFADGEIIQQINAHCLPVPHITEKAVIIHHYLIEFILEQLSKHKPKINFNWISALVSGIITSLIMGLSAAQFSLNLWFWLAMFLSFGLVYWGVKQLLLLAYIRCWRTVWGSIVLNNSVFAKILRLIV